MSLKQRIQKAFKELGKIDKLRDTRKITQKQHNSKSLKVLERLMKTKK